MPLRFNDLPEDELDEAVRSFKRLPQREGTRTVVSVDARTRRLLNHSAIANAAGRCCRRAGRVVSAVARPAVR